MKKCKSEETSATEASRRRRSPDEDGESKKKAMWKKGMWEPKMCTAVCEWKERGILNAAGNFSGAGAKVHLDKVYPEKYRTNPMKYINECATNSSSAFSMDDNFSGYKQFGGCLFGAHMKTCGIKWPEDKGNKQSKDEKAADEE